MKIAFLEHRGMPVRELAGRAAEVLAENGYRAEIQMVSSEGSNGRLDLRGKGIDVLATFNLQGFEQETLMGGIAYNLFDCKQIHILTEERLSNEKYLEKQLSISMFFFCVGKEHYNHLLRKYPDIPYLEELEGWEKSGKAEVAESNAQSLASALMKVADICHLKRE